MTEHAAAQSAELSAWLVEHEIETVIAAGIDQNGVLRGKRLPVQRFLGILEHGVPLCDVFWAMDVAEEALVERPEGHRGYFPTKARGYPDILLRPDLATARLVPWHDRTALFLGSFHDQDGVEIPIDPRVVLRRVVERARASGYEPMLGLELELYLLDETPRSLEEKGYIRLQPVNVRPYTYGVAGSARNEPLLGRLRSLLTTHGIAVEAANLETGPAQVELNLRYGPALQAADATVLFKNAVKEIAAQEGVLATFMAKPHAQWAGNSCHLHLSLWQEGRNAFWDGEHGGASAAMRSFMAGVLETMADLAAFAAPTVNSYRRYHAYSWAGTTATWGHDNRSTGLRTVLEGSDGTRLEHRQGGGDVNPHLLAAAALAAGLDGIERGLEPPPETQADAYLLPPEQGPPLPRTLDEALDRLERSERARDLLGADLVDYYVVYKRAELEAARAAVTDWEVRRYLEMA
jgi:glutamine synthetase